MREFLAAGGSAISPGAAWPNTVHVGIQTCLLFLLHVSFLLHVGTRTCLLFVSACTSTRVRGCVDVLHVGIQTCLLFVSACTSVHVCVRVCVCVRGSVDVLYKSAHTTRKLVVCICMHKRARAWACGCTAHKRTQQESLLFVSACTSVHVRLCAWECVCVRGSVDVLHTSTHKTRLLSVCVCLHKCVCLCGCTCLSVFLKK